eukprot:3508364-Rhodomonas_salina.1
MGCNMLPCSRQILDVGCGIGGPYRNIARFTGWDITGITINEGQVRRGNELAAQQGLAGQCRSVQGDFLALPFEANSFDGEHLADVDDAFKFHSTAKNESNRI